jgi:hypothetical protein
MNPRDRSWVSVIIAAAQTIDPQLQHWWIAEEIIAFLRKEGLPTTEALHCPSTGSAMQPHQRQQHSTTTAEESQIQTSPHPHGEDYARAISYSNAAEYLRRVRNDINHSAYRMRQGNLLTDKDLFRLHNAASEVGSLVIDMQQRANHFKNLAHNPEPVSIS